MERAARAWFGGAFSFQSDEEKKANIVFLAKSALEVSFPARPPGSLTSLKMLFLIFSGSRPHTVCREEQRRRRSSVSNGGWRREGKKQGGWRNSAEKRQMRNARAKKLGGEEPRGMGEGGVTHPVDVALLQALLDLQEAERVVARLVNLVEHLADALGVVPRARGWQRLGGAGHIAAVRCCTCLTACCCCRCGRSDARGNPAYRGCEVEDFREANTRCLYVV
jgi:hypothetical protein